MTTCDLPLEKFRPIPQLVRKSTHINRPKFPAVDAHNHLGEIWGTAYDLSLDEFCGRLDEAGITHYVDLDGGWGEEILIKHLEYFQPRAERFFVFAGVDWDKWQEMGDDFPAYAAHRLEVQKSWGASGLKIWKKFGLDVRDHKGVRVSVDDERLDPIWETAGNLGLPVMIHVADPVAFFEPLDETNERWEELHAHPDWHFPSPPFPAFTRIISGLENLVLRHPKTVFIGAHVGCYAENLDWVGSLLDRAPNFYVDISARIGELGRQPYSARRFFIKYDDRILFGLDEGPDVDAYRLAYRFLETDDEYFNYNPGDIPLQGRWHIYGIYLPDDVLEKIYRGNARRILKID